MTHELWTTLNHKMYEYLSSVSLFDLVEKQARKAGVGVSMLKDARRAVRPVAAQRKPMVDVLPIKDQRVGPRPRAKMMAVGV